MIHEFCLSTRAIRAITEGFDSCKGWGSRSGARSSTSPYRRRLERMRFGPCCGGRLDRPVRIRSGAQGRGAAVSVSRDAASNSGRRAWLRKGSARANYLYRKRRRTGTGAMLNMLRSNDSSLRSPAAGVSAWGLFCDLTQRQHFNRRSGNRTAEPVRSRRDVCCVRSPTGKSVLLYG